MQEFQHLLSPAVQEFIRDQEYADEAKIVLGEKPIHGVSPIIIAQQISGRRKAKDKLPEFYATAGLVYPPSLNLEQCSSQATAEVKLGVIREQLQERPSITGADLTAGFGVDSFYLSKLCVGFDCVEPDADLIAITKHNHRVLCAMQIRHHNETAQAFIERIEDNFSFIYLDPSRRKQYQKVFRFSDCFPDITKILPAIFRRTPLLLIKTSPLMDLQQGLRELGGALRIVVVAVRNECREVLFLVGKNSSGEPLIECLNVTGKGITEKFVFLTSGEKVSVSDFSEPRQYLYEPNAAILKAGAFKIVGQQFGVAKLHKNTHLYTSSELVDNFPGRIFKVVELRPGTSGLDRYFPEMKANVVTRNYPATPEALRKKLKLRDGGEKYLVGFSGLTEKFTAIADRLK